LKNSGFEAGGYNTPSNIDPWSIIGDESSLIVSTDRSSCFDRNKIALRMEVLCGSEGINVCPPGGVGIHNPGFWGMVRSSTYCTRMLLTFLMLCLEKILVKPSLGIFFIHKKNIF